MMGCVIFFYLAAIDDGELFVTGTELEGTLFQGKGPRFKLLP
jgi:hypothetical protein